MSCNIEPIIIMTCVYFRTHVIIAVVLVHWRHWTESTLENEYYFITYHSHLVTLMAVKKKVFKLIDFKLKNEKSVFYTINLIFFSFLFCRGTRCLSQKMREHLRIRCAFVNCLVWLSIIHWNHCHFRLLKIV